MSDLSIGSSPASELPASDTDGTDEDKPGPIVSEAGVFSNLALLSA